MSFSSTQIRKLQRDVKACDIRTREVNGRDLHYIEGWHAIAEANRIFGFDAWSRETVESRCVTSRETRGTFHVLYIARVRITVRADAEVVVREGFGTGEAHGPTPGEAHDKAIKTAETDATKRAFATFGKPFGLSLYLGSRRQAKPDIQRRRTLQRLGANGRHYVVRRPIQPLLEQAAPKTSVQAEATAQQYADGKNPNAAPGDQPLPHLLSQQSSVPSEISPDENNTTCKIPPQQTDITIDVAESEPALLIDRPRRRRDPEHLKHVGNQPCLICSRTPSDAHHLKFAQPAALSMKVSDEFTVPLCRIHHRQLHDAGNEIAWWMDLDIDPLPIARDLWLESKGRKESDHDK